MKKHRPYIACLLAGVFVFNLIGYCLFSVLLITHKKSVFNKILHGEFKQEELVILYASDIKNASWEHEKEFEWNGEMYDVVKQKSIDGDIEYACKKDTKEDHLKKQKRKAAEKTAAKKLAQMNKIFVQHASSGISPFLIVFSKQSLNTFENNYLFVYSSLSYPPPKA